MTYSEKLIASASQVGNTACMGLDPQLEVLPFQGDDPRTVLNQFFQKLFRRMALSGLIPSAFKPNIGYYQGLDHPRDEDFSGSLALADIMDMVENFFPGIPIILDSKRGDIARSSLNYANEAFSCWGSDAVTVAPFMGCDSVRPFIDHTPLEKGVYILNRTSNPGGRDLQNLKIQHEDGSSFLYQEVARQIISYNNDSGSVGAVVGATNMDELKDISLLYAKHSVPLLIPGVGSQGGSAPSVMAALRETGYPVKLARINSSSELTHPWKKGEAPEDWLEMCESSLRKLLKATQV